jgi:hypothetical protein
LVAGQHLAADGREGRKPESGRRGQLRAQESNMANDAFMKPEVPDSFRELMKVSIEQTKRAFDTFAATITPLRCHGW